MARRIDTLKAGIEERFGDRLEAATVDVGELTLVVTPEHLIEVCTALRDEEAFRF